MVGALTADRGMITRGHRTPCLTGLERMSLFKKRRKPDVRPRYGEVHRATGAVELLTFEPSNLPGVFDAYLAADHTLLALKAGESLRADVLGPGQSIRCGLDEDSEACGCGGGYEAA